MSPLGQSKDQTRGSGPKEFPVFPMATAGLVRIVGREYQGHREPQLQAKGTCLGSGWAGSRQTAAVRGGLGTEVSDEKGVTKTSGTGLALNPSPTVAV